MVSFLIGIFTRLGLPEGLQRLAGYVTLAVLAFALLWALKAKYDRDLIAEYERGVQAGIAETLAKADKAATEAAGKVKSDVEQGNDAAREAASGSDDPLKSGLGKLGR